LEEPLMNWVTAEILTVGAILTGPIILLAIVLLRLLPDRGDGKLAFQEFSIARYQLMTRLTAEEDFEFLSAQPGYRPETGARLRRERRRIFRLYLRALAVDFRSLHAAARKLVADAPERHADLVGVLIRSQFVFWWRMTLVEFRLLLSATRLPKLDIAPLFRPMESIRIHMAGA
jgi:hypothetical protein